MSDHDHLLRDSRHPIVSGQKRALLHPAVCSFVLALLSVPNFALGETWYCTTINDPTAATFGQKVEAYRVDADTVRNLTGEQETNEIKDPDLKKLLFEQPYRVLRNDNSYIVAERDYPWNDGLNIACLSG